MAIVGVSELHFGVTDMETCVRFWRDFGLTELKSTASHSELETREGAKIVLRMSGDAVLPPAPVDDPTARLIVWGATSPSDLDEFAARLDAAAHPFTRTTEEIAGVDPGGYAFSLRLWQRREVEKTATRFNAPGVPNRVDDPAPAYKRAHPPHLAHVVVLCPDLAPMIDFYRRVFGFKLSDSYPGFSCFLRCPGAGDHHNLYLLRRGDANGFHHVAFDVNDIHELFGGGLSMQAKGWKTHLGPGRHPTSSAYFWYFVNPCGGTAEYDFDADVLTDAWVPREMVPSPELFAEWALHDGINTYKGQQKTHPHGRS
jgi:catechol 2,3-dioxygenase-like lactoylglutathione lyase family enzyme